MATRKIRIPEDDFTFWLDGDGIPCYRGGTEELAIQKVRVVVEIAEKWLTATLSGMDQEDPLVIQKRTLRSEIKDLSEADHRRFDQLCAIAQEVQKQQALHLTPENIDAVLSSAAGIPYSPTVRRVLIRWASIYLK